MMKPIKTDECNMKLTAPSGEAGKIDELPVFAQDGIFYSYWKPTERELTTLNEGGVVVLSVMANQHPPVRLTTDKQPEIKYGVIPSRGIKDGI